MQGQLIYRVIGDLSAPGFFSINQTTGVISVRNDLNLDSATKYILRVQVGTYYSGKDNSELSHTLCSFCILLKVYDSGATDETNETTVEINVRRNSGCPEAVTTGSAVADVWETTPAGTVILTVIANDSDNVSTLS